MTPGSPDALRRRIVTSSSSASLPSSPLTPLLTSAEDDDADVPPLDPQEREATPLGKQGRPTLTRSNTGSSWHVPGDATPHPLGEDDLFSGLSLLDFLVLLEAHTEQLTRGIRKRGAEWKGRADALVEESKSRAKRIKLPERGQILPAQLPGSRKLSGLPGLSSIERERLERLRQKTRDQLRVVQEKWQQETVIRLRDKISFLLGVFNVFFTALILGSDPTWLPAYYSIQLAIFAPIRVYSYKRKLFHYFLFDLCYAVNILCMAFIWVFPSNVLLFQACYGLTLGTLGTAIATWRNSLVFHSLDKVISLAIHIFPPLVFTVIRHHYPNAEQRYPALKGLDHLHAGRSFAICMTVYLSWQAVYYRFVVVARREKIKEGRATSFTYLINDKKRIIGRIAAKVPADLREPAFMGGQAIYTLVTLIIPIFVLYNSKLANTIYMFALFGVAVWNGASFYLDVTLQRSVKLQKELQTLKQEFDAQQQALQQALSSAASVSSNSDTRPSSRRASLDEPIVIVKEGGEHDEDHANTSDEGVLVSEPSSVGGEER